MSKEKEEHSGVVLVFLAAILYSAGSGNIRHTLVAGKFVKRDGKLLCGTAEALENADRCARGITVRGKGVSRLYF